MKERAIYLEKVKKYYGSVLAVNDVTLEIFAGEFFTLLGASGSGKTTLLRTIGGFEPVDEGRVFVSGDDMTRVPAYRRPVHTVFQDYALFPHMTVFENVAFSLRLKRVAPDEVSKRVLQALETVRMGGFDKRQPGQLSGGQRQRVALARSIVDHPAVLLLDEPLSAIDAKVRAEVREELKRLQRETGITFIYVTHDQEEALTLSDRMAVMRGGKLLQVGTPEEVYENPADLFVASFIGKANFFAGELAESSGNKAKVKTYGEIVAATLKDQVAAGGKVRVMVRPENLALSREAHGTSWEGKIIQSQYLGHATEYLVAALGGEFRALELRSRRTYREGETVHLSFNENEALVYREAGVDL